MEDSFIRADVLARAVKKVKEALRDIPRPKRWYVCALAFRELDEEEVREMEKTFRR